MICVSEYEILNMFGRRQQYLVTEFNRLIAERQDYSDVAQDITLIANSIINVIIKIIDVYKSMGSKDEEINELLNMICDEEEILEVYNEYMERRNEFF
jgi:hypothetical protein